MARITLTPVTHLFFGMILLAWSGSAEAVTREEILDRAQSWAELTWYADSANTTAWDTMFARYGCEDHQASDWDAGETYVGMAYSYGGNDDTTIYIEKLEDDSLAAGNHMCHYQGYGEETGIYPPDWTTGIDCSAFVCRCWGVPRTNCTGLYNKYHPLDKQDVQPGDALVKPGSHTVLIADPGENPPYGTFELYEASGSACRVWYNPEASWATYAAYSARSLFKSEVGDTVILDTARDEIICQPLISKGQVLLRFPNTWDTDVIGFHIFNVTGQRVYSDQVSAPDYEFSWNGTDCFGRSLPRGVYAVRSVWPVSSRPARFVFLR